METANQQFQVCSFVYRLTVTFRLNFFYPLFLQSIGSTVKHVPTSHTRTKQTKKNRLNHQNVMTAMNGMADS